MSGAIIDTTWAATQRARYESRFIALRSERATYDSHWMELAQFVRPRRGRWTPTDRNRGDKRNRSIINSTASFSMRTLQSGMHSGLTSPARPWMALTTLSPELNKRSDVRAWLDHTTKVLLAVFQLSNFYNTLPIVYGDVGLFATAAMSILEDDQDVIRCYAYPIGSYVMGQNHRQKTAVFMREYELSVRQVVEEFALQPNKDIDWSVVSKRTKALWDTGNYEAPVIVVWAVQPNEDRREGLSSKDFAFTSTWWERGVQELIGTPSVSADDINPRFLREAGFNEFPLMCPRWDITGEDTYGTDCPGMISLGDVKQLQSEERQKGRAIAKMIDPPLVGPTSLKTQKTSLISGDITYVDVREGMQGLKSVHDIPLNLGELRVDMRDVEQRIQRAWYEDLFLMLASSDDNPDGGVQPITAREVAERHEEKLLALGPVLERLNDELYAPIIDRTYAIAKRRGLIPPAPKALHGVRVVPRYTSIMAEAQKLVALGGLDRFMQSVVPLAQTFGPAVTSKINPMAVVDQYADALGVDRSIVVDSDKAQAAVSAQQAAAAKNAQAEQLAKAGPALAKMGAAPVAPDSPLDRIISNVTGAGAPGAALGGGG